MATAAKSYNLSVVVEAIDKITGPLKKVTSAIGSVGSRFKGLGAGLRNIGDQAGLPIFVNALAKVVDAGSGVFDALASVAKGAAAAATAVGLSTAAVLALVKGYADATGAIGDAAERTGASRERIQELGFAAKLSGSSAETLEGALLKMNIAVGNATKGSKELKEMFAGLKISLKNTDGSLKSTDQLFDLFVNRISRIKDPALQAKAAVTIFGKSATELLPLIRSGNKGIAEMAAEARRLGVVLSDDAVHAGEDFGDTLDKIEFAVTGATNTILKALIPSLDKLGNQLIETIVKYRPQIEAFAAEFAKNLPRYIDEATEMILKLKDSLAFLGDFILWVSDNLGVFKTGLAVVTGVVIATVLPAIITLTTAIWSLGAAILATPIGWILLAAAALVTAAVLIYKNWDQFSAFFIEKFEEVKKAFSEGFVKGLWRAWKEFNPISLIIEGLNNMVKFATGIDIAGILKEKLGIATEVNVEAKGGANSAEGGGNPNYTAVPEGGPIAAGLADAKAKITLDFKNMPAGVAVDTAAGQGVKVQTNQGYSMMPAAGS